MKFLFFILLFFYTFSVIAVSAQNSFSNSFLMLDKKESIVLNKNYPLLSYLLTDSVTLKMINKDKKLASTVEKQRLCLRSEGYQIPYFDDFILSQNVVGVAGNRLLECLSMNTHLVEHLKKIPAINYLMSEENLTLSASIRMEWVTEANGINHTIKVYGDGQKPHYPNIDSISRQVSLQGQQLRKMLSTQITAEILDSSLFFAIPLKSALLLLELNGRMNAADYEPLQSGANKPAVDHVKKVDWEKFPYSHILVPGAGPETADDSINPDGLLRCRLAALLYFRGMAPFIIVSGGRVHPYKTRYSEAEEMKKYLVGELGIPASAIIMEPHARHTTTNIRNSIRLLDKYGIPIGKKGLICTTEGQSDYIRNPNFAKRCMDEMGICPFQLGKFVDATTTEYQPKKGVWLVNPQEPLDP